MKFTTPLITAISLCASAAFAGEVRTGMEEITILDAEGNRHLSGFMWYPTTQQGDAVQAHGNAVWEGIPVLPSAQPMAGNRPLVVMSHGMFGNARNQAWLAEALVAEGFIVAAIDHPGTSTFQRDPDHRRELWERPKDISRLIDFMTTDSDQSSLVDDTRVFMAGHSLGGYTATALAGGRFDPEKWDAFCAEAGRELVCGIFDAWSVAKSPEDRAAMSADLSDARIRGFAVFDLGGTQTFSTDSLGQISTSMLVYGAPEDINGVDLDIESRALVSALNTDIVTYHEPKGLAHFDFLGVCTDKALAILKEQEPEDVFVCEKGREERRREHDRIASEVSAFFDNL